MTSNPVPTPPVQRKPRRRLLRVIAWLLTVPLLLLSLFVFNGLWLAHDESPIIVITEHAPARESSSPPAEIKILAWNIAKGFVHKGGLSFENREVVEARMQKMIALIRDENPDFVFLSEAVTECGPSPVNQVAMIAQATGMHTWAFGENYNIGLPFYRMVGGNAILSRQPLEVVSNPSLAGRQPFYVTKNNRRVLWCAAQIAGQRVLLASIHTDSFNLANNLEQTKQILAFAGDEPAILAGDFNAKPDEASIKLIRESGRYAGEFAGPLTFPADKPNQTIDFIFVPRAWELIEHRVVASDASDHLPVVSRFRVK